MPGKGEHVPHGYRPRYARAEPEARHSGRWRKVAYAVLAGAVLAGAVLGVVIATDSPRRTRTTTAGATAAPRSAAAAPRVSAAPPSGPIAATASAADASPGAAAVRALQALLGRSAAADRTAAEATDDAEHCNDLPGDDQAFDRATVSRQGILDDLAHVRATALPEGPAMLADLGAAERAAMTADSAYETWVEDLEFRCAKPTTDDRYHAAALADARTAAAATARFQARWRRVVDAR